MGLSLNNMYDKSELLNLEHAVGFFKTPLSIKLPRVEDMYLGLHVEIRSGSKRRKESVLWRSDSVLCQKPLHPQEKSEKQRDNTKTPPKTSTTIADRLRTVSWGNDSHSTGVVKPIYERSTFPLTAKAV